MPAPQREIKRRIKSVGNIRQITRALQLVATAKMKKSQKRARDGRFFANAALEILENLAGQKEVQEHILFQKFPAPAQLAILITTNRGFCGGLNVAVLSLFSEFKTALKKEGKELAVITIGKKGGNFAKKTGIKIVADFSTNSEQLSASHIGAIARIATDEFLQKNYNAAHIFYTHFISTISQATRRVQLLPLDKNIIAKQREKTVKKEQAQPIKLPYLYEPTIKTVFEKLIPYLIEVNLYNAFVDSQASEHSARMVAMKNATEQAGELIDDLRFSYNQARQANITREIAEISSGALASG
jgi:F-type H+-transporting ATPase subunit gamma